VNAPKAHLAPDLNTLSLQLTKLLNGRLDCLDASYESEKFSAADSGNVSFSLPARIDQIYRRLKLGHVLCQLLGLIFTMFG
jgi:hypothetical protein